MKKNWYEIEYEKSTDGECQETLYTSHTGLSALIIELQKASDLASLGKYELKIPQTDEDYEPPFTHVQVVPAPPSEQAKSSYKAAIIVTVLASTLVCFSVYGIIHFVKGFL